MKYLLFCLLFVGCGPINEPQRDGLPIQIYVFEFEGHRYMAHTSGGLIEIPPSLEKFQ